ncbi:hypothetical protein GCM10018987_58470 [Streptomyces cremeus]
MWWSRSKTAITVEVLAVAPILFTVVLLLPFVTAAGPFALYEARNCVRPGRGRHRLVVRGRHAAPAWGGRR